MLDPAVQRANMVASQLRTNDVTDARIQDAMLTIPREDFVPENSKSLAYAECCISLKPGRVMLDPRAFAKLAELAAIRPEDVALDVGCGTGYSSAVLALLAGKVIALEEDAELAARAEANLPSVGALNVQVVRGALADGCPQAAPFDVIFVNGSVETDPKSLLAQLRNGGRLVTVKRAGAAGYGCVYLNHEGAIGCRTAFDAHLPILPGFEKPRSFVF